MKAFRDLAINTKLTLFSLLAGGMALLLSCVGFATNDIYLIRTSMVRQMSALATVLGSNCTAALVFQDSQPATELLTSLRLQPAVEFACIYDASGKAFATYSRSEAPFQPPVAPAMLGSEFVSNGDLDVVHEIERDGQPVGKIYLRTSMAELHDQMLRYVNIAAVVMIVSLALSMLLSSKMQRAISVPILRLAQAAQQVSLEGDYAIRVEKTANDELGTLYDQFNAMLDQIQQGKAAIQQAHDELELKIEARTAELSRANTELVREVAERLRAEGDLESAHQQLMISARRAGMAEIATGVLHNVGNVLNTVNVSATLIVDYVRQSRADDLMRAANLMEAHADDLGTFITSDPKGKQLPGFISLLALHFVDERADINKELDLLVSKVNHIKTIVATQQSYAGISGVIEAGDVSTLLDDALKLNIVSFDRHKITVLREYQDIPRVQLDRQKVLQILINLLNNAKESLAESRQSTPRTLTLRVSVEHDAYLVISFIDNGMGIPPELLTRIFSHGFTTKKTGHGFGLHSCANAASEMGGSLSVHSGGTGQGATFTLKLPYQPQQVPVSHESH